MKAPSQSVTNKLYGLSRGLCAFPGCAERIVELEGNVMGEICHIKARRPGRARYDAKQNEEDRFSFANLILLCRNHHKLVDEQPGKYEVEDLRRMKEAHERNGFLDLSPSESRLAKMLLESYRACNFDIVTGNQSQVMFGNGGKQVLEINQNTYQRPPRVQRIIERRPDSVSREQAQQIRKWIDVLVENTFGKPRNEAYRMWYNRFYKKFTLERYDELPALKITDAEDWFLQHNAILKQGKRAKLPNDWRNETIAAIKAAMNNMGRDKETYYPEMAVRLKMRKPFESLTKLTKADLKRVYNMVMDDQRQHNHQG